VHVRQVGGDEPGQVTVQLEPRRHAGGGQDRLEPLGQVVEQVVQVAMLLGGGFGGERIVRVEEAQDLLVLVVAVRPQQREQAVPALPPRSAT
jgi:hypothetical protein